MIVLCDIYELLAKHDGISAVSVVKNRLKYEWASLMVFTNSCCKKLIPEFIDDTNNSLFDLAWAPSVGELPAEYNHCVGYDEPGKAKVIHFTQGIPCFEETSDSEYSEEWMAEIQAATKTVPWKDIMGESRHYKPVMERYLRRSASQPESIPG